MALGATTSPRASLRSLISSIPRRDGEELLVAARTTPPRRTPPAAARPLEFKG